MSKISDRILESAKKLCDRVDRLNFSAPTAFVYNPLDYAWGPYSQYVRKWGSTKKRVLFLGMNPGPWGMAQVGVPFGEINIVKNWLRINAEVRKPDHEHPKRPVEGFECKRSEVSGRRLWTLFEERFQTPKSFFECHFVENYCPLVFVEESGRNRTPDNLPAKEKEELFAASDHHLQLIAAALSIEWVVGIGRFAAKRAAAVFSADNSIKVSQILHPSPASPAANRGWAQKAIRQLTENGVWKQVNPH